MPEAAQVSRAKPTIKKEDETRGLVSYFYFDAPDPGRLEAQNAT